MRRSVKLIIGGKVQGVGLRELIKTNAEKLRLQGTAQNSDDGTVVVYVSGQDEAIESLIDAVYLGTKKSKVDYIATESFASNKDFRGVFRVIGDDV